MKSKELIQAHISFLEQNMKHDSILKSSLINDDMLEIEAYKKVLKDLEELEKNRKVMCKPIVELIKDLERLEKQDKALKILNEYKETIKERIESLKEYKKYIYDSKNETEYFKTIGSIDAYDKVLSVLSDIFSEVL